MTKLSPISAIATAPLCRPLAPLALAIMLASLIACSPVTHHRGYVFVQDNLDQLATGATRKDDVRRIMGSPSAIATVDGAAFYYIFSRSETYTYHHPEEVERRIVAVHFDEQDVIANIKHYGLEDGHVIDYVTRETITRGKELSLLGQLFGNLGRFSTTGAGLPSGN